MLWQLLCVTIEISQSLCHGFIRRIELEVIAYTVGHYLLIKKQIL